MSSIEKRPLVAEPHRDEILITISELAERLAEVEAKVAQGATVPPLDFSDDKLATIASSIYQSRRMRSDYFNGSLLIDPAWDMLLDLFILKIRGRRVSAAGLCLATNIPESTARRWIDVLVKEGLLCREPSNKEEAAAIIEISPQGFEQMRRFIVDSVTRFNMPMPD
jgi:hypothetical protein